jgi:hypothetical protein
LVAPYFDFVLRGKGTDRERRSIMKKTLSVPVVLATMLALLLGVSLVAADVDPPTVEATLKAGESLQVTKTVTVPDVPPKLDLFFLVDLTGSYWDDLEYNIKPKAPDIFDDVRAAVPDSQFGLGSFQDFPFEPWGWPDDVAYSLRQGMTADRATWLAAVNAMAAYGGRDGPESQYEALFQTATGAGKEMPPTTDGDYDDLGEIAPGQDPSFRADAAKVLAITTDAPFHTPGDSTCYDSPGCPFDYPGASRDDTVDALNAVGITVIAIKAPGAGSEMDDLAAATGGTVKTTDASSTEIAEAIIGGIEELEFDITGHPVGCDPLEITFEPPVHEDVPGGSSVEFEETIAVPGDFTGSGTFHCTVEFKAGDAVIGVQEISITVPPPTAITLASFTAEAGAEGVTLAWETGTEVDNAGFNLHRAMTQDGPWTQINSALIPAQGDPVSGASYSFLDRPDHGTFYYQLEDVDLYGVSTLHGPVKATLARPLRRPLYRPRLPEF